MNTTKKVKESSILNFEEEYNFIIKNNETIPLNNQEWSKKGDFFTKLTLYKEYTPVKTSCSTTLFEAI